MRRSLKTVIFIILILMALISVVQGARNALHYSQDFQYDAALALRSGINPYKESINPGGNLGKGALGEFYSIFNKAGAPQKMEANQFPSLLMLLFPMTVFPYETARVLWLVLNLLFTAAIVFFLRKTFLKEMDRDIFVGLMLLMVAGTPYRNQLGVGQHSLFSFAFFLFAVCLSEKKRPLCAGLALSVSYFKYTLTAPLALYFLYKRRFKEFVISLIPHIIGTFAGARMLNTGFTDMITQPLKVSSALAGEGFIDIGALTGGGTLNIITAAIMVLCLVLTIILPKDRDDQFFSLMILLSLIMTYHRIYDFFVLSAVSCGIALLNPGKEKREEKAFGKIEYIIAAGYGLLLLYFFFIMRMLGENSLSENVAAVIYYLFLVLYIFYVIKESREKRSHAG